MSKAWAGCKRVGLGGRLLRGSRLILACVKLAVVGALPEEANAVRSVLSESKERKLGAHTIHEGVLQGVRLLVAQSGIGKVNAAALSQALILDGITHLIFTGVAGAVDPRLRVGDIVISTDAVHHDRDAAALGFALGEVPGEPASYPADAALRDLATEVAHALSDVTVVSGRIASGEQFIADPGKVAWIRESFAAACAEMEGAAVAQVCAKHSVPWVIVRSMSDTAGHDAGLSFAEFTPLAAERAKELVVRMVCALSG